MTRRSKEFWCKRSLGSWERVNRRSRSIRISWKNDPRRSEHSWGDGPSGSGERIEFRGYVVAPGEDVARRSEEFWCECSRGSGKRADRCSRSVDISGQDDLTALTMEAWCDISSGSGEWIDYRSGRVVVSGEDKKTGRDTASWSRQGVERGSRGVGILRDDGRTIRRLESWSEMIDGSNDMTDDRFCHIDGRSSVGDWEWE